VLSLSYLQLPLFVKLASDEIWGVRKACAESLVILSQNLNANERNKTLVPVFENLAEDVHNKQTNKQTKIYNNNNNNNNKH
jgi:hypothetical protein